MKSNISWEFGVRTLGRRTRPLTWKDRKPAEAHANSRKLKIAQPPTGIRIFSGNSALELRAAAPENLTWEDRKPTESHGGPRKLKIARHAPRHRIFHANSALELQRYNFGLPYQTPYMESPEPSGRSRKLTEAKNRPNPHSANVSWEFSVRALGFRARRPYMDRPEDRASSRKLKMAYPP